MKKIIPLFKTNCGETVSGNYSIEKNIIQINIEFKGSQLLSHTVNLIQKILNNRNIIYHRKLNKIFWRIYTLPVAGSRKQMVENVLSYIHENIC